MVLTDSTGNPRSFPIEEAVSLDESHPYLLREEYPDAIFWQLSYGNMEAQNIINSAAGYLNDWNPDIIIVQLGIIDCRTEAFTEFQKLIIAKFLGPFFRFLGKHTYNPRLIKYRKISRVSKVKFKKIITKFNIIFNNSKFFWLEVSVHPDYESARPGTYSRVKDYNKIIADVFGDGLVKIQSKLLDNHGFNNDNLHLNKVGHKVIADELKFLIDKHIRANYEKK